jgi:hypothetical protein
LEQNQVESENNNNDKDEKIQEIMHEIDILKHIDSEELKLNPDRDNMSQLGEAVYKMMTLGDSNNV